MKTKRILALLLSLVMVFALAACGGSSAPASQEAASEEAGEELDLQAIYEAFIDLQADSEQGELMLCPEENDEMIGEYYVGLSDFELKQRVIAFAPVTGGPLEIALVEAANPDDVEGIKKCFEDRIARGGGCGVESEYAWEHRSGVQVKGNYVAMIVLPDGFIIPDDVFALGK